MSIKLSKNGLPVPLAQKSEITLHLVLQSSNAPVHAAQGSRVAIAVMN